MAIFKSGSMVGPISGKLGGLVYSHNSGGQYIRMHVIPTNPGSVFQQAVRNFVSTLTTAWRDTLTANQRSQWNVYAFNSPLLNRLGESRPISGIAQYLRCNVPRLQASLARVDAAPVIFGEAPAPATVFFDNFSAGAFGAATFDVNWTPASEPWDNSLGAALLLYTSRPQNVSVEFFKGPYRFADSVNGAVVPPTSPQTITAPFAYEAGALGFARAQVTLADGRLSPEIRLPIGPFV